MRNQLPRSHQAIVRNAAGVKLQSVATPAAGPGELLLAPLTAGLCGTDIQILRGERHDPASVLGHEAIARIIEAGTGCPGYLAPGKLVVVNPTHPQDPTFLLGHLYDGMFQEYVRIPAPVVSAGLVVVLDDIPSLELAALIEPLAAVIYAFELLRPQDRDGSFIIYGDGIIGHLALLLARIRFGSALPIIFVHHRQEGLEWSRAQALHGDIDCLFSQLPDIELSELPVPGSALIATPRTSTLKCLAHAVDCIMPHGCIDILGGVANEARLENLPGIDLAGLRAANCGGLPVQGVVTETVTMQHKPVLLCGHRGVSNEHLLQSVSELIRHGASYRKLISHLLDLHEAAIFMHQLFQQRERHINGRRVMKLGIRINPTNERRYHE
jgi:threonine dehydrogenase-like Zn-dependent dehydrogenase